MVDSNDPGALRREQSREISGPATRIQDPLVPHISQEPEQGRINDPFPVHVPAGGVSRGPPASRGVPTRPGRFFRDRLERLHPERPSLSKVGRRVHPVFRPLPRIVELPRMSTLELKPVQGGMPLQAPRATHPVVVLPTPERCGGRPIFRRTIEAKQILASRAKGHRVKAPGVAAPSAEKLPVPIASRKRRPGRVAGGPDAVPMRVFPDPGTVAADDLDHGAPSGERP